MASAAAPAEAALAELPSLAVEFCSTWGPGDSQLGLPQFAQLPFRLFSRTSRIGKAADFGNFLRPQNRAFSHIGGRGAHSRSPHLPPPPPSRQPLRTAAG